MSILETQTGNASFTGRTAKVQAFFVPTRDQGGKELPLGVTVMQNAASGLRVMQRLGEQPAGQNMKSAIVGAWRSVNYEIPDGTVVKIFAERNINGVRQIANQYIRMRSTAAFRTIKARLTDYPKATLNQAVFRGCFDVLSPDEAKALGAHIPAGFERFYSRAAVNAVFVYEELAAEREARKVMEVKQIETSTGETKTIAVSKSRRKLVVD